MKLLMNFVQVLGSDCNFFATIDGQHQEQTEHEPCIGLWDVCHFSTLHVT